MSFGTFPGVGLKAARAKRYDAEKLLDQGQDPVAMREAKRKGARVLGLCNAVGSTIARESDGGVYIHAGP